MSNKRYFVGNFLLAFMAFLALMPLASAAIPAWVDCLDNAQALSDDGYYYYSFPFEWVYYGETIPTSRQVTVSANGTIELNNRSGFNDWSPSLGDLQANKILAPLWTDLQSSSGYNPVYRCEYADHVIFRWNTTERGYAGNAEDFEAFVYSNGGIYFVYNQVSNASSHDIATGVSMGNNEHYQLLKPAIDHSAPVQDFGPISTVVTCPNGTCSLGEYCPADATSCTASLCYMPTCESGCGQQPILNGRDPGRCDSENLSGPCTQLPCTCALGTCVNSNTPPWLECTSNLQNLGDDGYYLYSFPFEWVYYGETIPTTRQVTVSANGTIELSNGSGFTYYVPSLPELQGRKLLAPFWTDLANGSGYNPVYRCEYPDHVVFRWNTAEISYSSNAEDFEVFVYDNGEVFFVYDNATDLTSHDVMVGASAGNNVDYDVLKPLSHFAPTQDYSLFPEQVSCPDGACDSGENCPADSASCPDNVCYAPTCVGGCGQTQITNSEDQGQCDATSLGGSCTHLPCSCDSSGQCTHVPPTEPNDPRWTIYALTCLDSECQSQENEFLESEQAFLKVFESEGASLTATLRPPAGSDVSLAFSGDYAQIPLSGLGSYRIMLEASKPDYGPFVEYIWLDVVESRSTGFEGPHFEVCLDAACEEPETSFVPGDGYAYVVAYNWAPGTLSGQITLPDNSNTSLTFSDGVAEVHLVSLGDYLAEITISAEGYNDYSDALWFEVVTQRKNTFDEIFFQACLDSACDTPDYLFEVGDSPIYIKAYNTEAANLSGVVTLPGGGAASLTFDGDNKAEVNLSSLGSYSVEVTASKPDYETYTENIFFDVVQDKLLIGGADFNEFNTNLYFIVTDSPGSTEARALFADEESPVYIRAFDTEGATLAGTISHDGGTPTALVFSGNNAAIPVGIGAYLAEVTASKEGYIPKTFYISFKVVDEIAPVEDYFELCNNDGACGPGENHDNCPGDCPLLGLPYCSREDVDGDSTVSAADHWLVERKQGETGYCGYEDVDLDQDVDQDDLALIDASMGSVSEPCSRRFLSCGANLSGLLAYYPFEDWFSSGRIVRDASGSGNNARPAGDIRFGRDGVSGRSATFFGNDALIDLPSGAAVMSDENFTISMWVNIDAAGIGQVPNLYMEQFYINGGFFDGNSYTAYIYLTGNSVEVRYYLPSLLPDACEGGSCCEAGWCECAAEASASFTPSYLANGQWHNIAVTGSNSGLFKSLNIYLDGYSLPTATEFYGVCNYGMLSNPYKAELGSYIDSTSNAFLGSMDEAMLFNRALSALEVQDLNRLPFWEEEDANVVPACGAVLSNPGLYILENDIVEGNLGGKCITITAPGVVLDCRGHRISITGHTQSAWPKAIYSDKDYTMVRNCSIEMPFRWNEATGITLFRSNKSYLYNNSLTGMRYGIWLSRAGQTAIENNNIASTETGIYFSATGSTDNNIVGNTIQDSSQYGLFLITDPQRTLVSGNTLERDNQAILLSGNAAGSTLTGNIILGSETPPYGAGIYLSDEAQSVAISRNIISGTGSGILVSGPRNEITDNNVSGVPDVENTTGIKLNSFGNIMTGNKVKNFWNGIQIDNDASNNLFERNISCGNANLDFVCGRYDEEDGYLPPSNYEDNYGQGNWFTGVVACPDGFPAVHVNYEECPFIYGCADLSEEGKTYLLDDDIVVNEDELDLYSPRCIGIGANHITLDCQGHSITGSEDIAGIYSGASYTTIKNCRISMAKGLANAQNSAGILLSDVTYCSILNNVLVGESGWPSPDSLGQWNGLVVQASSDVSIVGNVASRNAMNGILLDECDNCSLESNIANANGGNGILVSQNTQDASQSTNDTAASNITEYNYQNGLSFFGANDGSIAGNVSCENALVETQYDDFRCSGSSGNNGSGNVFGSVTACDDGWPAGADPNGACRQFHPADITRDGVVDLQDAYALDAEWNRQDCSMENAWCRHADITKNGSVGMEDADILLAALGNPPYMYFDPIEGLVFIYEGDFVISSLTLNPPSISPPGTVDVRVVVRNIGTSVGEADVALSVVVLAGGVSKATGSVSAVMGAGEERAFSIPISVDSSWQTSNYIVRVSVHSEGVVQAEAMKVLSVGPQGIGQAFSVPEITILLLPLLAAIALFLVYRKRKG